MSAAGVVPVRVVSLLPSATEIFASLVQEWSRIHRDAAGCPQLVGRSHECDYPTDFVSKIPILTTGKTSFTSSLDTHRQVQQALNQGNSLYHLNVSLLHSLQPDIILTQDTCQVCSIDLSTVENACQSTGARIITVQSTCLQDALFHSVTQIGKAVGLSDVCHALVKKQLDRYHELVELAKSKRSLLQQPKRVMVMEWLDPLFLASGWTADMMDMAGATRVGSRGRQPDDFLSQLLEQGDDVDMVIVCLCGLDCDSVNKELSNSTLVQTKEWKKLKAVQLNQVFVADGNSMFHRPTGRLLDAFEWLIYALYDSASLQARFPEFPGHIWKPTLVTSTQARTTDIEDLHKKACLNRESMYKDPKTGYSVLTAHFLKERRVCCGNGCRHCPYGHVNVKDPSQRVNKIACNVLLKAPSKKSGAGVLDDVYPSHSTLHGQTVLFWSGGKDSLLALEHSIRTLGGPITLLTTVDPDSNVVNIQNIPVPKITAQAKALNLPLYLVPVPTGVDYTKWVKKSLEELVSSTGLGIQRLVFGDLHLQDIRQWRENAFSEYTLDFPLFDRSAEHDLLPHLFKFCHHRGIQVRLSSIESEELKHLSSNVYNQDFIDQLLPHIDKMGEKGEFHTCVDFTACR